MHSKQERIFRNVIFIGVLKDLGVIKGKNDI